MPYSDSGESISKGEISTVVVAARACGNVKNLSLLTGYTGGQQASCGHEYPCLTLDVYLQIFSRGMRFVATNTQILSGPRGHDSAVRISNNKVSLRWSQSKQHS